MKKLDKSYLTIEFKNIFSSIYGEPKKDNLILLNKLSEFTENYVDTLIESRDKSNEELRNKIESVTNTSIEMQEKLNASLNQNNSIQKNLDIAYEANHKLHDDLVKKGEQVDKLINACITLIEKQG